MTVRLAQFRIAVMVALSIITVRLAHLQLIRGAQYFRLAEQNRLRVIPEPASRGLIVDRRDRLMASNQIVFRVAVIPQEAKDLDAVLSRVSTIVHQPIEELRRRFQKERSLPFVPAMIVPRVSKDVALRLEEERWCLPGLLVKSEVVRHYPLGTAAAHVLGYLSQPTPEELPVLKSYGVRPNSLVGRMGIERAFEPQLRGKSGGLVIEVNHRGRQMRLIGERASEPGQRVGLTLDAPLQSLIEQAFGAQAGAAVVLDPDTGAVLAMVSTPSYAPEAFALQESRLVQQVLSDSRALLLDRATMGTYMPGSIAKLVTAAAALEAGLITPETTVVCPGALTIGDRAFHCWNRDGHGPLTLTGAILQSCNVYWMTVGRRLGLARLRSALTAVGFGQPVEWPFQARRGTIPQRRLTEGEIAMLAIGQGEILITPLQAALMAASFANGGRIVQPWLVRAVGDRDIEPRVHQRALGWSGATLKTVGAGMRAVVAHPEGTGFRALTPAVAVAGKTGTAQTHRPEQTHGWFVGFCPYEQPRAALAVVAEYGGSGGDLPTEIARTICEYVTAPETL